MCGGGVSNTSTRWFWNKGKVCFHKSKCVCQSSSSNLQQLVLDHLRGRARVHLAGGLARQTGGASQE